MSDIKGIPPIEGNSFESETGNLGINDMSENLAEDLPEKSENIENNEEGPEKENSVEEGPSDSEVLEVRDKTIENINEDVADINNPRESTNNYLMEQLKEPEAHPEVGEEQLLKIDRINRQIEKEGNKAINDIENISVINSENLDNKEATDRKMTNEKIDNLVEEVDKPGETPPSEEVVDKENGWINEELDPKTEEFLKENGEEDLTGKLTPEELKLYENFRQLILDRFPPVGSMSSMGTLNKMLDSLPNEEEDTLKQAIKILLRMAVRLGTRIVAFVADEIVKSADKDDKTTKFIFGSIRDAAKGFESMADTAITGKDKSERLTKTTRDFIFGKKSKS